MSEHAHGKEMDLGKKLLVWFEFVVFGSLLCYFLWNIVLHVLGYLGIKLGGH